ncbi:MAG TPA: hypothetical protein PKN45_11125 [Candidatus Limiplasma sp.]|nr:hypothetical protein [Candidatus Limiplasma sp.]
MKKFLTVLVLLVLLATVAAFALPALAEEVDYKAMSADELIAMRKSINEELAARLASDASNFYTGSYKIGVDIKPGTYLFTCTMVSEGMEYMTIDNAQLCVGDTILINLSANDEENYLNVYDGSGTIQLTVKPDWAP